MRIDKAQVLDILRGMGKQTSEAERELPDVVDTETDSELLGKFGLSSGDLLEQFGDGYADERNDRDGDGTTGDGATLPTGGLLGLRASGVQGGSGA